MNRELSRPLQLQLQQLRTRLADCYRGGAEDWQAGVRCCQLALAAAESGCYGVGAVLLDESGQTLAEGHNQVFLEGFHSSAHAEMLVLDRFEAMYPAYGDRSGLTLVVSLEPCPMCLVRSMLAGIGQVRYLVEDIDGGMAAHGRRLPAAWRNLASLQQRQQAAVSSELRALAAELAAFNIAGLRRRLLAEIR